MKTCKVCNRELPRRDFYSAYGGFKDSKCKNCRRACNKIYQNKRNKLASQKLW